MLAEVYPEAIKNMNCDGEIPAFSGAASVDE
jgi:hypothetical protein